jgi:hypothetical protein
MPSGLVAAGWGDFLRVAVKIAPTAAVEMPSGY